MKQKEKPSLEGFDKTKQETTGITKSFVTHTNLMAMAFQRLDVAFKNGVSEKHFATSRQIARGPPHVDDIFFIQDATRIVAPFFEGFTDFHSATSSLIELRDIDETRRIVIF